MNFARHLLATVLVLAIALPHAAWAAFQLFPITNANVWRTPHNWWVDSSGATTYVCSNNPGAYLKFRFTGASQLYILVDTTLLPSTVAPLQSIRYYVDADITNPNITDWWGEPTQGVAGRWYLPVDSIPIQVGGTAYTALPVPKTFDATTSHEVTILFRSSESAGVLDRWVTPVNQIRISHILLSTDTTASLLAPLVRSRSILMYWDSHAEGINTESVSAGRVMDQSDSAHTFAFVLARSMLAEISIIAFNGQGITYGGNGGVPYVFPIASTLGRRGDSDSSWDKYSQGRTRLNATSMLSPTPDFIFIGYGLVDSSNALSTAWSDRARNFQDAATGLVAALRAAAPTSRIIYVMPFGGHYGYALSDAFARYATTYSNDTLTSYVDAGYDGTRGLSSKSGDTPAVGISYDTTNPSWLRSIQIGNMLVTRLNTVLGVY